MSIEFDTDTPIPKKYIPPRQRHPYLENPAVAIICVLLIIGSMVYLYQRIYGRKTLSENDQIILQEIMKRHAQ